MHFEHLEKIWRTAADGIAERCLAEASAKKQEYEAVCSLLSDEDSRHLYASELASCLLGRILKESKTSEWTGLMSWAEWNGIMQNPSSSSRIGALMKDFSYPSGGMQMMQYFLASTFIFEQYRYRNLVSVQRGDICIDCGACLGDTSMWMLQNGASEVHSFEIDKKCIGCLKKTLNGRRARIVELAVSDEKDGTAFYTPDSRNIGGGTVSRKGNWLISYQVKTCRIDDYCTEQNIVPNFIKMDIEGAEMSALRGAQDIIRKYSPKLAICIYHSWEDRFDIPLLIHEINPDYRMYLKKSHPVFETVLFCAP